MTRPDRDTLPRMLESGILTEWTLGLDDLSFRCTVEVTEGGALTRYAMAFRHLTQFVVESRVGHRESGDTVELTQLWIDSVPEESPTEEWAITISSFDSTIIRLRCPEILVDSIRLA